jgi:hypothetical protein
MRQGTGFRIARGDVHLATRRVAVKISGFLLACLLLLASPVFADSKDESLRPLGDAAGATDAPTEEATDPALEKKYRAELENRLARERESYEGSLRSLWLSNAAVWGCLIAFIIFQAISARRRTAELERLRAKRESE